MRNYCSPSSADQEVCYVDSDFDLIIDVYNKHFSPKISKKNSNKYNTLNSRLKKYVGDKSHFLWIDFICQYCSTEDCNKLQKISDKRLMPRKPASWYVNHNAWLSNFDIENVLIHYHNTKKYKYELIGVFTVDFAVKDQQGRCLYAEQKKCNLDIKDVIKRGKNCMGIVTNLDKHDQPGSHWTSLFFVINPNIDSYGIYYYDSTGAGIPSLVMIYIKDIQEQLRKIYPKSKKIPVITNKKQYQFSNTECGMFAITYQVVWITHLYRNKKTENSDILNKNFNDKNMSILRDYFFTPRNDAKIPIKNKI